MARILDFDDKIDDNQYILNKFPLKKPRPGQIETIKLMLDWLQNSNNKYACLEAPTGSGKSVMAYTIAQFFDSVYYITSSKQLQSQLIDDFGTDGKTVDLKGRNAYPCIYWDIRNEWLMQNKILPIEDINLYPKPHKPYIGCDEGVCKIRDKVAKCSICISGTTMCKYFARLNQAQAAHMAVMNFKSFLFQTSVVKQFHPRRLLIIDEAHNAENQLLDFVSISLSDISFSPLKFPKLETVQEYIKFIKDNKLHEDVISKARLALLGGKKNEADDWEQLALKLERLLLEDNNELDKWICQYKESKNGTIRTIELKPIFINTFAKKYLFDFADKILLMSATILDPKELCNALGIDEAKTFSYKMASRFPIEHRPILLNTIGSLSYKNKHNTYPKLIDEVTRLCKHHHDQRGIIHTHNFEIARLLIDSCPNEVTKRFKFQHNFRTKEEMLQTHSTDPTSIIIAPAMHEGIDLKDDLARFQIITKVPYPSLADNKQLEARMKLSPTFYDLQVALKLCQSYGRVIRNEEDWAITYILDSDIHWFLKKAAPLIPTWFSEAIQK